MPLFGVWSDGKQKRERRVGSRITRGIDGLSNLDAPKQPARKAARTEAASTKAAAAAAAAVVEATPSPSAGVFGTWDEWRSVLRTLFPNPQNHTNNSTAANPNATLTTQQQITLIRGTLQRFESMDAKAVQGLATIDMWRLRARTTSDRDQSMRVPRYVEATAVVAEAQMMDRAMLRCDLVEQLTALQRVQKEEAAAAANTIGASSSNAVSSPTTASSSAAAFATLSIVRPSTVANSYGGAISRALHTLTGGLIRTKSFDDEETSYRSRAQEVGLPEEAVEVRRRVAHGNMPLIPELRLTAALVMEHLHDRYWDLQESQVKKLLREDEREVKRQVREAGNGDAAATGKAKGRNNAKGKKSSTTAAADEDQTKRVSASDVLALLDNLSDDEGEDEEGADDAEDEPFTEAL